MTYYIEIAPGTSEERRKLIVRVREDVPTDFAQIIGDAIHNLRAALDLLVCEAVRAGGHTDERVEFPFSPSAEDFDKALQKRRVDLAGPAVVDLIKSLRRSEQNETLRSIHDLDIVDKHRALIPVSYMIGPPERSGQQPIRFGPIRDGAWLGVDHTSNDILYYANPSFVMEFPVVALGNVGFPLGGREIIPTLIELAAVVEHVIDAFTKLKT